MNLCGLQRAKQIHTEGPLPLPFIDLVLITLEIKWFFSFPDGFSGYNKIQIAPEDQDKTTFTYPGVNFLIYYCHSVYAMSQQHFKVPYLVFFVI